MQIKTKSICVVEKEDFAEVALVYVLAVVVVVGLGLVVLVVTA